MVVCERCGSPMRREGAHDKCDRCGWLTHCCEGDVNQPVGQPEERAPRTDKNAPVGPDKRRGRGRRRA
jgi:hypothetical protein